MTSNDLWPPWKTIGIIYSPRATNVLSLKFKHHSLLEISCLQSFDTLTSGDLKWPLTSMKNNRDHLLTMAYQRTKFEVQATFTSWDIVFTSQGVTYTHTHTHTHPHTPSPSHRFLRPSARNQKWINENEPDDCCRMGPWQMWQSRHPPPPPSLPVLPNAHFLISFLLHSIAFLNLSILPQSSTLLVFHVMDFRIIHCYHASGYHWTDRKITAIHWHHIKEIEQCTKSNQ